MERQFIGWQIDEKSLRTKYLQLFDRNAVSELSLFSRVFGTKSPTGFRYHPPAGDRIVANIFLRGPRQFLTQKV
jgi:hypothetical protein